MIGTGTTLSDECPVATNYVFFTFCFLMSVHCTVVDLFFSFHYLVSRYLSSKPVQVEIKESVLGTIVVSA